jgi:hypothetical protein
LIGSRQPTTPRRSAYVRSRTAVSSINLVTVLVNVLTLVRQASFITDTLIFQSHSKEWLVTDILHRTAGIPPHIWDQVAQRGRVSILSARASKGVPIWLSFQGLLCDVGKRALRFPPIFLDRLYLNIIMAGAYLVLHVALTQPIPPTTYILKESKAMGRSTRLFAPTFSPVERLPRKQIPAFPHHPN